jgi:hypothetical protein
MPGADAYFPSVSRDGTRLIYAKDHSWNDVYVGDLKDNGARLDSPRRFTSSDSLNFPVTWTRDSRTILLLSNRLSENFQLFRQRLGTDTAELLVRSTDDQMFAALSPDAAWILYVSQAHGAELPLTSQQLMRVPASGGWPEQVLEMPKDPMAGFRCPSRAASPCVISHEEQGQLVFYALDPLKGQGTELIRTKLGHTNDMWWNISPDGSRIAIATWTQLGNHLRILELRNGTDRDIELPQNWIVPALCWAADSNVVFAYVYSPGTNLIVRIELGGKINILLDEKYNGSTDPVSLSPSPDGRHLAYLQPNQEVNLWLLENF